jgi:hypothetical protein
LQIHLTQNSHFKYGSWSEDTNVFYSQVGHPKELIGTGLSESVLAAEEIQKEAGTNKIILCLSGGVDSECLALSFLKANIAFEVAILELENGFNNYDVFSIKLFCEKHSIKYRLISLNIIEFFETGKHLKYGEKYQCQSPQIAVHLWLLDQLDGFCVLSGNFIYPTYPDNEAFFVGLPGDLHCAYFRYFEANVRAGIPWFFIYSPELVFSFYKTSTIKNQIKEVTKNTELPYSDKCLIYNLAGFDVKPRADKYTGFEKVRFYYDQTYGTTHGVAFNQLFRFPLEKMNPFPKEYLQIVPDLKNSDFLK